MQRLIAAINKAKANAFVVIVMTNRTNLFRISADRDNDIFSL